MSRREKRLAAIRANVKNVRFADLAALLNDHGYEQRRGRGAHVTFFNRQSAAVITVPRPHGDQKHVRDVYVKEVLRRLGVDDG